MNTTLKNEWKNFGYDMNVREFHNFNFSESDFANWVENVYANEPDLKEFLEECGDTESRQVPRAYNKIITGNSEVFELDYVEQYLVKKYFSE